MATGGLKVHFWGVRGSHGCPGPQFLKYGGNTPCVEVRSGDQRVIFDTGTGIIELGKQLAPLVTDGSLKKIFIFYSHYHHDHVQGLCFFQPIFNPEAEVFLFGAVKGDLGVRDVIAQYIASPLFPVDLEEFRSRKNFVDLPEDAEIVFSGDEPTVRPLESLARPLGPVSDFTVQTYHSNTHPSGGVQIYRVLFGDQCVVYATDTEGIEEGDPELIAFAGGADLLIHDTYYTPEDFHCPDMPKAGFGHGTVDMAIRVAKKARVRRLALFHHNVAYDDDKISEIEQQAQDAFPGSFAAREDEEVHI